MLFCRFESSAFLHVSLARKMNCKLILTTSKRYQAIKKLSSGTTLRNRGCSWMRWIGVWGMISGALVNRGCIFSFRTALKRVTSFNDCEQAKNDAWSCNW